MSVQPPAPPADATPQQPSETQDQQLWDQAMASAIGALAPMIGNMVLSQEQQIISNAQSG